MASSREKAELVYEKLKPMGNIRFRSMMGEYIFYYNDIYFGALCDDRFMIKITKSGREFIKDPIEEIPYEGAKPMFVIKSLEDMEYIKKLIEITCSELPKPKKKSVKKLNDMLKKTNAGTSV